MAGATSNDFTRAELRRVDGDLWTALPLTAGEPALAIALAGDWTTAGRTLDTQMLLLSFALRSVRERDRRREAERLLAEGYTMTRRLGRLGGIDAVCQRVVDQTSRSLGAERVALALYRPEEDRLAVAAAHGYSTTMVQDVRIAPGSWILGHVYSSGRSVLVSDVRRIRGGAERRPYKTFSFAAVPVRAGGDVVGVLSATDKADGSPFDRRDAGRLQSLVAPAGLALMAARSETEVRRLAHAARVDPVTGLFNRRYFDARLSEELERARRESSSLTVLMADVDDFKAINDRHGHQAGDAVLHLVGGILRSAVRVFDVCARYGGDEFVILMPGIGRSSAAASAERIRRHVAESRMPGRPSNAGDREFHLTMSIGVAVSRPGDAPEDLLRRADRSLYQSKAAGKDTVRVDSGQSHEPGDSPDAAGPAEPS
jgi:diguanylate cyclase (GGDEF)-like protein